ncbi:MAG TPA: hypothetical protein VH763_05800 [Gemmatimonadales bacterium]|jgi:hypothetical protein
MTETRISASLTIAFLGLTAAAVWVVQPYSASSPWSVYNAPGQRFLSAALSRDTAELSRLSVASGAVDWAIRTYRDHPYDLSVWAHFARAEAGISQSDTTRVLFETATEVCPLLITFVGPKAQPHVLEAKPRCYSSRRRVHRQAWSIGEYRE